MTCKIYQKTLKRKLLPHLVHAAADKCWLEVKPLRRALLLFIKYVLLGLLEVFIGDFHAAFT